MLKPIKCFTRAGNVKSYKTGEDVLIPEQYEERSRELRGVWFSTVAQIDLAQMTSSEEYQAQLIVMLDKLVEFNFNTVVFQVRPTNDAFYQSELNPWSRFITGEEDRDPGFDILAFVCTEAEQRGIDVHAWINPYRVSGVDFQAEGLTKAEFLATLSEKNFARRNPELVLATTQNKTILDPASPRVQAFVSDTALEIAEKYPVKAIHMDDYFYPYEELLDPDEDAKRRALAPDLSIAAFRRFNVDELVRQIHDKLRKLPWKVEFGISPFGIWQTNSAVGGTSPDGSFNNPGCFTCYNGLYADVVEWMKNGWIDYVAPQLYFEFDNYEVTETGKKVLRAPYADLCDWWSETAGKYGTKLYIGQALYRYSLAGNWANPEEIINQLKYNQRHPEISGTIFFTYRDLVQEKIPAQVEARRKLKKLWTKPARAC